SSQRLDSWTNVLAKAKGCQRCLTPPDDINVLSGTRADNERHAIARAALLNELLSEKTMLRRLATIARDSGLSSAAWENLRAKDVQEACAVLLGGVDKTAGPIAEATIRWVREELGLSWAWLASELQQWSVRLTVNCAKQVASGQPQDTVVAYSVDTIACCICAPHCPGQAAIRLAHAANAD